MFSKGRFWLLVVLMLVWSIGTLIWMVPLTNWMLDYDPDSFRSMEERDHAFYWVLFLRRTFIAMGAVFNFYIMRGLILSPRGTFLFWIKWLLFVALLLVLLYQIFLFFLSFIFTGPIMVT